MTTRVTISSATLGWLADLGADLDLDINPRPRTSQ
jgi:hypothetical protein